MKTNPIIEEILVRVAVYAAVIFAAVILIALVIASTAHAETPSPSLKIAVMMDQQQTSYYPSEQAAKDRITLLVFATDKVFREQVGVSVVAVSVQVNVVTPDDEQPSFLLYKLGQLDHHGADALVLLTDRPLHIGSTYYSGYANVGAVCQSWASAAIRMYNDFFMDAETLEHELGHVLGAPHDGSGACATTPQTGFIMSQFGYSAAGASFSQCSIDTMRATLAATSCTAPQPAPPIGIVLATPTVAPPPPNKNGGALDSTVLWVLLAFALYMWWTRRI
jgi:hypothetical protein